MGTDAVIYHILACILLVDIEHFEDCEENDGDTIEHSYQSIHPQRQAAER